jgi:hypothetical protein
MSNSEQERTKIDKKCRVSYTSQMKPERPPTEEIAKIRANIERLEKAREACTDSGIRKLIEEWIEEQKHKLRQ